MNTADQLREIAGLLVDMDDLFAKFYEWLAGQYSPVTGGFYYARSSFEMEGFNPDIESTAQAVNILERSGLLDTLPMSVKSKLITFFQCKQDPVSGYFYDEDANMRRDEVMVARAFSYSTHSLQKLGGKPLHPLPGEAAPLPEWMSAPAAYVGWLRSVDLCSSWRGCDLMSSSNQYVARLGVSERQPYVEAAAHYLASIQNENGLWGGGNLYIQISGTFKLSSFYKRFGVKMPNMDRIYATMLRCLRGDEADDMCWIRNPIDLLETFRGDLHVPVHELREIVEITLSNMRKLLRQDGGFSREIKQSPPAPNVAQVKKDDGYPNMPAAVPIGRGLVEGDMNAGTQALLIRENCHLLAGIPHKPLAQYTGQFAEKLGGRP
ncbi:hypothetical protein [Paenibacillus thalictri]|uniref:Squalene cyclase C-terminal domain-containing protein n=1 Tax=Paenibacillus thalictri TaxID=2527873 RepID=A0A4Q9DLJ8_9BACL|nr:hypothetical protein [Paenibacillus thalictri]TBL75300.1 hypothetical protein EYB31_23090 [Paenibacillus thalictri]